MKVKLMRNLGKEWHSLGGSLAEGGELTVTQADGLKLLAKGLAEDITEPEPPKPEPVASQAETKPAKVETKPESRPNKGSK